MDPARLLPAFALVFAGFAAAQGGEEKASVVFRDARPGSGIDLINVSGEPDKRHILSTLGSGVALLDYDEDGDLDLYLANGARLAGGRIEEVAESRLYRNEGSFRFVDVTRSAGLVDTGWGFGVAAADVDDDGLADLYVTRLGPNRLYRNRGDGTFEERATVAGVDDDKWGTSAAFFDADGDGDLDLYVGNYVRIDVSALPPPGREPTCQWFGVEVMCGPKGLPGSADVFYRNDGTGGFTEATTGAGLHDATGAYALGVVVFDSDDDGDLDLFVANDSVPNFLYRNEDRGRFTEVGLLSGVALSSDGLEQAGMGVDAGDLNGDGRIDLVVTNFSHETNNVYRNHGSGLFADSVGEANLHASSWFALGWGTRLVDVDHDADLDLFVANGHVYPGVDETNLSTRYDQRNQLFWNDGRGGFELASPSEDDALHREASSRAAAFGDLDGDGDVDGVVVNIDAVPTVLDNQRGSESGNWIRLRLVGRSGPRDAIGARVELRARGAKRLQVREVHPSGSFLSSSDPQLHFGLGAADDVQSIRVRWPGGSVETYGPFPANARRLLLEKVGLVALP